MQSNRGNFGNYILKEGVNVTLKKPSWNKTETVFRPYPSLSYEDPTQFLPYRIDPSGRNVFGHWIRRYDCAWGVGNPGHTFLLHDPGAGDSTYDPWMTPLGILYRAIESACKKGQGRPEWYPLREGASGRGRALRAPSEVYLMQGILMRHDNNNLYGPGKVPPGWGNTPPCMLMLSSGIGKELIRQLCLENEDFQGDPADFENRYVNGDPVSPLHGRYMHFFQKGFDPRQRYQANPTTRGAAPTSLDDAMGSMGGLGGRSVEGDQEVGFDMFMSKDLDGMPAFLTEKGIEIAKSKWQFWEDVLWFPTEIEQAHILFKIFPISACLYAFDGVNQDWIPEDARRRAANAVSVMMPGQLPGQQMAPGFGSYPAMPGQSVYAGVVPSAHTGFVMPQQPNPLAAPTMVPAQAVATQQAQSRQTSPASATPPANQSSVGGMDAMFGGGDVDESVPVGSIDDDVNDGGLDLDSRADSGAASTGSVTTSENAQRTQQTIAQLAAARAAAARASKK